jgi:hypothetical protein
LQEKASVKPTVEIQARLANDGKEDPKWKKLTPIVKVDEDFVPAKVSLNVIR